MGVLRDEFGAFEEPPGGSHLDRAHEELDGTVPDEDALPRVLPKSEACWRHYPTPDPVCLACGDPE